MAIDPPPPDPALEHHRILILHCEKRVGRAGEKLEGAQREAAEADEALAAAIARRDAYLASKPPPARGELSV